MSFKPDILVTGRDDPDLALVVEVTSHLRAPAETEDRLKRYMFGMQCPMGMIVTPDTLYLYRDTYTDYAPDSIERVGAFSMAGLLDRELRHQPESGSRADSEWRLEATVQSWLEQLASGAGLSAAPPDLRAAIEEHVLPVLARGEIRAAGPRWRHVGS